jgi:hypothetical protein
MIGITQADRADAVQPRPADRLIHGARGQHLAHGVLAVHHRDRTGINRELGLRHRVAHTRLEPSDIP